MKRFNDYLEHEFIGVVEAKFIDKPNHAYKTTKLTNGYEENEVTIFLNGLYEFLLPNDSISKFSGNTKPTVYRNGSERTFNVNQTFWYIE